MTWAAIGRAIWTKVWPAFAALAVLAAWGLGSWLLSVVATGAFLSSGEPRTTHAVPPVVIVAALLLAGIAMVKRFASAVPPAPVPLPDPDKSAALHDPDDWRDWCDVFDVQPGDSTVELVGGPFDGRQALPPRPSRMLWVAAGENGIPDAFAARTRPEIREGARLLGHYQPDPHDDALTWIASD